jgi:hypothetical protein
MNLIVKSKGCRGVVAVLAAGMLLHACMADATAPEMDDGQDPPAQCVWIDGRLVCPEN